jgi:hypothetical protein
MAVGRIAHPCIVGMSVERAAMKATQALLTNNIIAARTTKAIMVMK